MKHIGQLKKWPLVILLALLFGVGAATTSVMANTQYMTVKAESVNVRLGPGLAYGIMGQVKSGNELTIIGSKNSWYQVRLAGNKIGWVASWLVDQSEAATTSAKVATVNQPVNVREYASQDAKQLGTLNAGDSVKVIGPRLPIIIRRHGSLAAVSSSLVRQLIWRNLPKPILRKPKAEPH